MEEAFMNFSKKIKTASIASILSLAFLAGCSSNDSSSSAAAEQPEADSPVKTNVEVAAGCVAIDDEKDQAEMKKAKANITDIYTAFGEGNLEDAQELSASTKATIQSLLKKYPNSCEAQLGYVATIISDIANNKKINDLLDTIAARKGLSKAKILSNSIEDAARVSVDLSIESADDVRNILVSDVQSAVASIIPSLDSAISYMTNIANDDAFTCHYDVNDRSIELDRGEFAPALAALYVAKASLTSIVSINLNVDDNGSYDWIDSLDDIGRKWNYAENAGVKQIVKLLGKDSKFTSIHDSWKKEYKNIPNLLDSAITYVQFGLQYGLEEAKQGLKTQENDLYIVGDDEEAHLSTKDAQKIIDSLSTLRTQLRTGIEIPFAEGKTIKYVPYNWYNNTDGILKYLPYHVINDASSWDTPDGGLYWSDEMEYDSYGIRFLERKVAESFSNLNPSTKSVEVYGWPDDEDASTGEINVTSYDPYIRAVVVYQLNGCKASFKVEAYSEGSYLYYEQEQQTPTVNWTIADVTIPTGMCRDGKYAIAYHENEVPNILYFTDAKGNKTVSIQELINGKMGNDGDVTSYTREEIQNLIVFPDLTFGGTFPDMTKDMFWNEILPAIMDKDDDDDDYDDLYPYYDEDNWYDDPVYADPYDI